MRRKVLITVFASLALLFLLLPAAQADQVQLYFTGTTYSGDLDPYLMLISTPGTDPTKGSSAWLNCDDHHDYIQGGEYWNANVIWGGNDNALVDTEMSELNGWDEQTAEYWYDVKAYIELHYSKANNPDFSNAIWYIFDSNWTQGNNAIYQDAKTHANSDSGNDYLTYRQHLTVYSYADDGSVQKQYCSGGTCYEPQEFDQVPDGGLTLMLLGGVLVGLEALRRRFRG